ncbi:hypothetical protein AB0I53_04075 [Saccharopolyspora sp. NPDC050389]|uniref:hypothetical protein n=1 Tax=Saccharopolyspora sp. NPDC050389 TaxID=3155516 RepID=UPI0033DE9D69
MVVGDADPAARLERLGRRLRAARSSLTNAARAASRDVEGLDRTGAVRVRLDADGIPVAIRIRPRWSEKLAAVEFAGAVAEAADAALNRRMAGWGNFLAEEGREVSDENPPGAPAESCPEADPRDLDVLIEHMLVSLDEARRPHAVVRGVGTAATGKLALTVLETGQLSCVADPEWIGPLGGARLTHALSDALIRARTNLKSALARRSRNSHAWDSALDEVFSIMRDPGEHGHR